MNAQTADVTTDAALRGIEPEDLARIAAGFAHDKKATDVVVLDVRGVAGYTDFFLIATGNTDRQVKAIHDSILEGMKKQHRLIPRRVEGMPQAQWILMDYLDVVVHAFTPDVRSFYRLEHLWGDVPRLDVAET